MYPGVLGKFKDQCNNTTSSLKNQLEKSNMWRCSFTLDFFLLVFSFSRKDGMGVDDMGCICFIRSKIKSNDI